MKIVHWFAMLIGLWLVIYLSVILKDTADKELLESVKEECAWTIF